MSYYLTRTLDAPFAEAVTRVRGALAAEGFDVISEIDVQAILRARLGVEFRPYLVLGACDPALACEALQVEPKIGAMLPCNVVIQDAGEGRTEVAAINPLSAMLAIDNPELHEKAAHVAEKLRNAVQRACVAAPASPAA